MHALYQPLAYRRLRALDPRLSTFMERPVAFMGTLRRPDGVRRLVVVWGSAGRPWADFEGIDVRVLPLPGMFDPPPAPAQPRPILQSGFVAHLGWPWTVEYRGGTIDPKDPSRVIIRYVVVDAQTQWHNYDADADPLYARGEFEGVFQNNDTLRLKVLSRETIEASK